MFEAIRSKLVGAWTDLRSRGLVTLFFFELVVVTLGVLIAQGVADWAGDRAALRNMEVDKSRFDEQVAYGMVTAKIWDAAVPCLDARMDDILRATAGGEDLRSRDLRRPRLTSPEIIPFTPEGSQILRERYGSGVQDRYRELAAKDDAIGSFSTAIAADWQQFALIDRKYGPVDELDRHAARAAAGRIKSRLVSMQIAVDIFLFNANKLGIEPDIGELRRVPVDSCETIWREGSIHVDVDTGSGKVDILEQGKDAR